MSSFKRYIEPHQMGFGLVEIMVALVIGMVLTLVITQALSVFEGQKLTTSGTADAQTNGSLALYSIQREAQIAGFALPTLESGSSALKCLSFTPATTNISPVTITSGGVAAGASDSVTVRYGDSQFAGLPLTIVAGTLDTQAQVDTTMACVVSSAPGNDALVTNGTSCTLTKVTAIQTAGPPKITLATSANVAVGAKLSCLGTWREIVFRVTNNQLERVENGDATQIGSDIVAIKAQYGISASASDNQVSQWVSATAASGWASPSVDDRNRIKAIRVAVIARNGLLEKTAAETGTKACSSTTAAAPTGLCAWEGTDASPAPTIDISNDANWQRYRYRVYETIIPLRNVVWSKETL